MSDFRVQFFTQSHSTIVPPGDLAFAPLRWSHHVYGGPLEAEIEAVGDLSALWDLTTWLRFCVRIYNPQARPVWYGFINEIDLTLGGVSYRLGLDDFANRIALAYTYKNAAGENVAAVTDWGDDTTSQARYGTKERRESVGDIDATQADQLRDGLLADVAYPIVTPDFTGGDIGATLLCRGFWSMLDWAYWDQAAGLIEHNEGSTTSNLLGYEIDSSKIAFTGDNLLHSTTAELDELEKDTRFTISNTASNDGVRTVDGTPRETEAQSYTATTISFDAGDDIHDAARRLGDIAKDTVIEVSGASTGSNNEDHYVDGAGDGHIQMSDSYGGAGPITTEAAGNSVTIAWGHALTMSAAGAIERIGTATLSAHGIDIIQPFTNNTGAAFTVNRIALQLIGVGSPADDITVALHSDNVGVIGTELETATIDADDIPASLDWVWCDFANTTSISHGTMYWIKITRGDSAHDDDWYRVGISTGDAYSGHEAQFHDGTSYYFRLDDANVLFRLEGARESTDQIGDILAAKGTHFASYHIAASSNLETLQFREGDDTARAEIESLLDLGTAAGNHLVAEVTHERHVVIDDAKSSGNIGARLDRTGALLDRYGLPFESGVCPVGLWLELDVVPTKGDALITYSPVYIERCEYEVATGHTRPYARGASDPWEIVGNV